MDIPVARSCLLFTVGGRTTSEVGHPEVRGEARLVDLGTVRA